MKKIIQILLVSAIAPGMAVLAIVMAPVSPKTVPSYAEEPYEGNCQYYDRYNADGSCDNSDPCDPETLKTELRGKCKDDPSVQPQQQPAAVEESKPKGVCSE